MEKDNRTRGPLQRSYSINALTDSQTIAVNVLMVEQNPTALNVALNPNAA